MNPVEQDTLMNKLIHAISYNNLSMVKHIVALGVNLNKTDSRYNRTPLMHAGSVLSDIKIIKYLIFKGADVNVQNNKGRSALHMSVVSINTDIINFLLNSGADINIIDNEGSTPLHWAAEIKRTNIMHILIKYGADLYTKDNMGNTPLDKLNNNHDKDCECKSLIGLYNRVCVRRLNLEDSKQNTRTNYEYDI